MKSEGTLCFRIVLMCWHYIWKNVFRKFYIETIAVFWGGDWIKVVIISGTKDYFQFWLISWSLFNYSKYYLVNVRNFVIFLKLSGEPNGTFCNCSFFLTNTWQPKIFNLKSCRREERRKSSDLRTIAWLLLDTSFQIVDASWLIA